MKEVYMRGLNRSICHTCASYILVATTLCDGYVALAVTAARQINWDVQW